MSIVIALWFCIIAALGIIVWWEYQRNRKRSASNASETQSTHPSEVQTPQIH